MGKVKDIEISWVAILILVSSVIFISNHYSFGISEHNE